MRLRNMGAGLACGAVLAVAGGFAIEGVVDHAEGQAEARFTVSAQQLRINQSISSAAVLRSNRALNYLAPIRTAATDAADDGSQGVRPLAAGAGQGWTAAQIADGAITGTKVADGAIAEAKLADGLRARLPMWAVVNADGTLARGSTGATSTRVAIGFYRVNFSRNLAQCGAVASRAGAPGFIWANTVPQHVVVATNNPANVLADAPFTVQVTCSG